MTLTAQFIQRVKSWAWVEETEAGRAAFLFLGYAQEPHEDAPALADARETMRELADMLWLAPAFEKVLDIGARVTLTPPDHARLSLADGVPPLTVQVSKEWARTLSRENLPILVFLSGLPLPHQYGTDDVDQALRARESQQQMRVGCTRLVRPNTPAPLAALAVTKDSA